MSSQKLLVTQHPKDKVFALQTLERNDRQMTGKTHRGSSYLFAWHIFSSLLTAFPSIFTSHIYPQLKRRSSSKVLKAGNSVCAFICATGGWRDLSCIILGPTQHSPSFSSHAPWKPLTASIH